MQTVLFALSGPDIVTSFVAGTPLYVGRPALVRAHAQVRAGVTSQLQGVAFKWQGTIDPRDPTAWTDVVSERDDTGVEALEHTFSAPRDSRLTYSWRVDARGFGAMRLLGRSAGGAGLAGDRVIVFGTDW